LRARRAERRGQKISAKLALSLLLCALPSALCALGCASAPSGPLPSPEWELIPQGVIDTFCMRLKAEGVAEGVPVTIVSTTQPIASMQTIGALAGPMPRKANVQQATEALRASQRSLPLTLGPGPCHWIAVDAARAYRQSDQMLVEMSAPLANPFERGQAGMFVRMSLAGEHGQFYWITLLPRAGGWVVGYIEALSI